jgi:pyrroline-5-carboxylate reductase
MGRSDIQQGRSDIRQGRSDIRRKRIGIIGTGKMGQALVKGLLASGLPRQALRITDADPRTRAQAGKRFKLATARSNAELAGQADLVVLAVKPQQFAEVVSELAPVMNRRQLLISIAAGITTRWLEARLPGMPVVRVMPNLPATVGAGFAAVARGRFATAAHQRSAEALFSAVGAVAPVPEKLFDAITAVSGSGPAYVLFLVDAWQRAARRLGLPQAVAERAISQTLAGSAKLLAAGPQSAAELIAQVASKRGTTEAALKVLGQRRVAESLVTAIQAAAKRSKAMAWS